MGPARPVPPPGTPLPPAVTARRLGALLVRRRHVDLGRVTATACPCCLGVRRR